MFRLTGADLPTSKSSLANTIPPTFRVWQGESRGLGVLARINTYANYDTLGFGVEEVDIPPPIATGYLLKFLLPFTFRSPSLEGFALLSDPTNPLIKTLWLGDGAVNLYSPALAIPALFYVVLLTGAPIPGRTIAIASGLTVKSVEYRGLQLSFTQQEQTLTISTDYAIAVGEELEISGTYTASTEFVAYAATFKFPGIDHIDRFDWMGVSFAPAPDANNPQAGQFIWNEVSKLCTVFSPTFINTPTLALFNYSKRTSQLSNVSGGSTESKIKDAIAISSWSSEIAITEDFGGNVHLTTACVGTIFTQTDYVALTASTAWVDNPIPIEDTPTIQLSLTAAWQSTFLPTVVTAVDGVVGNGFGFSVVNPDLVSLTSGWASSVIAEEAATTLIQATTGWQSTVTLPTNVFSTVGNQIGFTSTDDFTTFPSTTGWVISAIAVQETPGISLPLTSGWSSFVNPAANFSLTTQWRSVTQDAVPIVAIVNTKSIMS